MLCTPESTYSIYSPEAGCSKSGLLEADPGLQEKTSFSESLSIMWVAAWHCSNLQEFWIMWSRRYSGLHPLNLCLVSKSLTTGKQQYCDIWIIMCVWFSPSQACLYSIWYSQGRKLSGQKTKCPYFSKKTDCQNHSNMLHQFLKILPLLLLYFNYTFYRNTVLLGYVHWHPYHWQHT